jgi:hypothetical protein
LININFQNLPDKVYMEKLSTALGFENLDARTVNEITLASECSYLSLYFNHTKRLHGVRRDDAYIVYSDNFSKDGYTEDWVGHEYVESFIGNIRLPHLELEAIKQGEEIKWTVSHFYIGNDDYYITDDVGNECVSLELNVMDIYWDKEELLASGLLSGKNSKNKNPAKPKRIPVLVRRVEVFKNWLSYRAGMSITSVSDYQECYVTLGDPTQDKVWADLMKYDPNLFKKGRGLLGKGQYEFFKNQEIIEFEYGTGVGRPKNF